jgi:hypothetical protein
LNAGSGEIQTTGTLAAPVGGDLSGSLPNPTVAKIQTVPLSATVPTTGQVLEYNGSTWIPATPASNGFGALSTAVAINEATYQATVQVAGDFPLNPSDYNTNIYFMAVASVTRAALTGTVILQDLTSATTIATFTYSGTTSPTRQITSVLSLTNALHMYEVRYYVTGGSSDSDQILLSWAGFQVNPTPP